MERTKMKIQELVTHSNQDKWKISKWIVNINDYIFYTLGIIMNLDNINRSKSYR
jgi:hypothetical protein